jgi:hypothetical protein
MPALPLNRQPRDLAWSGALPMHEPVDRRVARACAFAQTGQSLRDSAEWWIGLQAAASGTSPSCSRPRLLLLDQPTSQRSLRLSVEFGRSRKRRRRNGPAVPVIGTSPLRLRAMHPAIERKRSHTRLRLVCTGVFVDSASVQRSASGDTTSAAGVGTSGSAARIVVRSTSQGRSPGCRLYTRALRGSVEISPCSEDPSWSTAGKEHGLTARHLAASVRPYYPDLELGEVDRAGRRADLAEGLERTPVRSVRPPERPVPFGRR